MTSEDVNLYSPPSAVTEIGPRLKEKMMKDGNLTTEMTKMEKVVASCVGG